MRVIRSISPIRVCLVFMDLSCLGSEVAKGQNAA
jgi:hypothetical protein